ncbi:hypothetical protein [Nonomuraea sp. NEAU-A123]|uniref:hypothetical protein n=1 Tax=Nonomuraea sp. NEAU-A123 TaxID=2839649 RepID=UPI001BE3EB76|nr:hypothetical protein [Nonomuraea sp. NEAU-A123]MBT2234740.1 hypothetical protein [Nonomuraea sp. NEAU-A123]
MSTPTETTPTPTIGRIVHYKLSGHDVSMINLESMQSFGGQGVVRSPVKLGDVFPAIITRTFEGAGTAVNLQVFLDGNHSYWATSRSEGTDHGQWSWPPRA